MARVVIIDRAEKTMESRLEPQRKLPESTAQTREIRRKRILVGTKKLTTDQRAKNSSRATDSAANHKGPGS